MWRWVALRAIRGAITVSENSREEIVSAAQELIECIIAANQLNIDQLVSVIFTATPDLTAAFPAEGARAAGLIHVPLLDAVEINVPGSLPKCIRVLVHVNTDAAPEQIRHVYLRQAQTLRPDLTDAVNFRLEEANNDR